MRRPQASVRPFQVQGDTGQQVAFRGCAPGNGAVKVVCAVFFQQGNPELNIRIGLDRRRQLHADPGEGNIVGGQIQAIFRCHGI